MRQRPRMRAPIVAALVAAIAGIGFQLWASRSPARRLATRVPPQRNADALVQRRMFIGRSVRGRPILAIALGDPDAPRKLLVVGCIHGNESAGIAIARRLGSGSPPRNALLWVVEDLNPDGVAADTRQNAHGVDLNRNFPWHWRRLEHRGALQYSGPHALSEPESRLARALILRVRPNITIWFHQPLGVVDESGGNVRIERRFAHLSGLPLERLTRYPGSAASWQDQRLRGSTAFVVELPPGKPSPRLATRIAEAGREIVGALSSHAYSRMPN
jgi:murein peptide amidase A